MHIFNKHGSIDMIENDPKMLFKKGVQVYFVAAETLFILH